MAKLFANSGDPDQILHSAESDLSLYCLPTTFLWDPRLKWVKHVHSLIRAGLRPSLLESLGFIEYIEKQQHS